MQCSLEHEIPGRIHMNRALAKLYLLIFPIRRFTRLSIQYTFPPSPLPSFFLPNNRQWFYMKTFEASYMQRFQAMERTQHESPNGIVDIAYMLHSYF